MFPERRSVLILCAETTGLIRFSRRRKQKTFLVTSKFQFITVDDAVYTGVYVPLYTALYPRRLGFFLRVFTNSGKKKTLHNSTYSAMRWGGVGKVDITNVRYCMTGGTLAGRGSIHFLLVTAHRPDAGPVRTCSTGAAGM
jgi:hypothetical protein